MDSDTKGTFILLIVGLLIFVFIVIIFCAIGMSDTITVPPSVTMNSGLFLTSCANITCRDGLVCDGTSFTCKLGEGAKCQEYSNCVTGLICSGLCATGATGSLNALCPCSDGYSCVEREGELSLCKGVGGRPCNRGSDCVSTVCNFSSPTDGICADGLPNSYPCVYSSECGSKNCNNGFCQSVGVITGNIGAACAQPCLNVTGSTCTASTCICSEAGQPGICVRADQGISSSCSSTSICANTLTCSCNDVNCLCEFPSPDPNVSANGVNCINGMTVDNFGICNNNPGLGCDSGGVCTNNVCSGSSVMASYIFSNPTNPDLLTRFPRATDITIYPTFPGPGVVDPHKLLAISNDNIDTIYLVDNNRGLLSIQYDLSTGTPSSWILELDSVDDVGTNGTIFVVAQAGILYYGTLDNLVYLGIPMVGGVEISPIDYVDISVDNDILVVSNGAVYTGTTNSVEFIPTVIIGGDLDGELMRNTTGPVTFYFDIGYNLGAQGPSVCPAQSTNNPVICPAVANIAYVIADGPLRFSGNISMMELSNRVYNYSIHSPIISGMSTSNIITLSQIATNNIVTLTSGGIVSPVPYRVGLTSRSVVSANAFYIFSIGSCA